MKDLTKLLESIEKRPFMFIKEDNIFLLESFISGFFVCETMNDIVTNSDQKFKDYFCIWLREKYSFDNSYSWSDIIKKLVENTHTERD